jgi:hypothetical protein
MRTRAFALAAFVAIAALVVVAGCGDDGGKDSSAEATTFCTVVKPVQDLGGILEQSDDTKAVQTAFTSAESAFATVGDTPPAAIKDDVATVKRVFGAANDALKKAAYNVDTAAEASPKAIEDLEGAEFETAADKIQTWSSTNC